MRSEGKVNESKKHEIGIVRLTKPLDKHQHHHKKHIIVNLGIAVEWLVISNTPKNAYLTRNAVGKFFLGKIRIQIPERQEGCNVNVKGSAADNTSIYSLNDISITTVFKNSVLVAANYIEATDVLNGSQLYAGGNVKAGVIHNDARIVAHGTTVVVKRIYEAVIESPKAKLTVHKIYAGAKVTVKSIEVDIIYAGAIIQADEILKAQKIEAGVILNGKEVTEDIIKIGIVAHVSIPPSQPPVPSFERISTRTRRWIDDTGSPTPEEGVSSQNSFTALSSPATQLSSPAMKSSLCSSLSAVCRTLFYNLVLWQQPPALEKEHAR
jgi:hypothetical protein